MDCRLPDLDGFAATREIRRRESPARRTPIVALTANTAPEVRTRCLDAGMMDHVAKPIRSEELDTMLRRWLASAPAAPSRVRSEPTLDATALLDRVEGDLVFVRELADGLLRDAPAWLHALRTALAAGDRAGVEQAAHAVRGSVGNLGGTHAAALAAGLESRAHAGDLSEGEHTCRELESEISRLHHALLALGDDHAARGTSVG
jgi:HPt (histidine-containing phosphotransfer) domain-containing protein